MRMSVICHRKTVFFCTFAALLFISYTILFMKRFYLTFLAFFLMCCCLSAQTTVSAITEDGKAVKRITFDKEKVTLIYVDDTQDENVDKTTVRRQETTGIKNAKQQNANTQATSWYSLDGRRLQAMPRNKGVYVRKQGNSVKKSIKR